MDQGDDPYKLLGVPKNADESEIKKSYRKLALQHHPDRQSDENARAKAQHLFAQIAGAYEILMDEDLRKEFDRSQKEQAQATGSPRGFDQQSTNIQFNDPYEVFKRNFKDEFGFEYPGAKFDFAEVPEHRRVKNRAQNTKLLTNGETGQEPNKKNGKQSGGESSDRPKKGGGMLTLFRGNKDKQLANKKNAETQLATTAPKQEANNRPTSMETNTRKIEHEDGTVETITEIKITRPDGSTETCRTSDKADKHPGWQGKNKPKNKMLTNGEQPKGLLTNGEKKKKTLLLTNGKKQATNAKAGTMVPYGKPPEQPKKRGWFGKAK